MKKKDFNRFLRRFLRAIIAGEQDQFFETIVNKKVMQNKINTEQLEELFFFRFFSNTSYKYIKAMVDGPTEKDKQFGALAISLLKQGWIGHAETMFNMFHDDKYREGYLKLIDLSKRKMEKG